MVYLYQQLKDVLENKTKKPKLKMIRNNYNFLLISSILVSVLTVILTIAAFVLSRQLISEVPYDLIKSYIRANLYGYAHLQDYEALNMTLHVEGDNVNAGSESKVISCYYNTPSNYEPHELWPSEIHPHLCTHINVAFARIVDKEIFLEDVQYRALRDIIKLRKDNPDIKILLSVGGAGNENGFSDMVVDHASRKVFIKSIKRILRNYTLDGIDLDWEFPGIRLESGKDINKRERQHFSQLLREIRNEYIREKRGYLLTVAVAAPETIVDVSYDIDQLNLYTDYVNIMTYDYHSYTKYTPFTGLNSPLYPKADEELYMATLNINYTVQMYIQKGLRKNKIVVGIPTYGHSFTLVNPDNARVGSPSSGVGSLGGMGFVNYPDICLYIENNTDVVVKQDEEAKVPYLYRQSEWVSYESAGSVIAKAELVRSRGLRGAMVYSLNADDFGGFCGQDARGLVGFPLLRSVKHTLLNTTQ